MTAFLFSILMLFHRRDLFGMTSQGLTSGASSIAREIAQQLTPTERTRDHMDAIAEDVAQGLQRKVSESLR